VSVGRTLLYGVGLGFRYYTAFGPLRLDLATPLHKRSADSPIQVYISRSGLLMRTLARCNPRYVHTVRRVRVCAC
jgi:hypothetical protein